MTEPAHYLRVVRRLTFLAVLALGLAACGGSGASKDNLEITLGRSRGTILPFSTTIAPDGAVTMDRTTFQSFTSAQEAELSRLVRNTFGSLKSKQCAGTFSDESELFITALGKTVTVSGACGPGFTKLWNALEKALNSLG
jgi:hypothetical protein